MTDVSDDWAGPGSGPRPTNPELTVRVETDERGPTQYVSQPPTRPATTAPRSTPIRPAAPRATPVPPIKPWPDADPAGPRRSGRGVLGIGLGFLLGAAVVGAFFAGFLLSVGSDETDDGTEAAADPADGDGAGASDERVLGSEADDASTGGDDSAGDDLGAIPDPADLPEGEPEDRMSIQIETSSGGDGGATATVREDGRVHFEGAFRSQDEADRYVSRAREVFGQEAVVERYEIDPEAPAPSAGDVALDKPVLFESGSAEIHPDYIPFLEACGDVLKLNPEITMSITAFTDSVGDEEFNLDLSRRRAQSIVDFYADYQVDRAQLLGTGFGEDEPIADNETEDGREQNRRAMLQLLNVMEGSSPEE